MYISEEHSKKVFGIAVWGYWFVTLIFLSFAMLANYKNGLQFNGTVIFAIIWAGGIILLNILPHTKHKDKLEGDSGLDVFWLENPDKHVLWILPVGFIGVLGASYIGSLIGSPVAGIFGSGIVMGIALFYTRSILIPMVIHGAFNSFVILAQQGILGNSFVPLALNPSISYGVPIIGNAIPTVAPILSESLNQLFIVGPSEEILKVVMIAGFLVFFKGYYSEKSGMKWIALFASVLIWSVLHYVQAI